MQDDNRQGIPCFLNEPKISFEKRELQGTEDIIIVEMPVSTVQLPKTSLGKLVPEIITVTTDIPARIVLATVVFSHTKVHTVTWMLQRGKK
jgi:hypothetical protein